MNFVSPNIRSFAPPLAVGLLLAIGVGPFLIGLDRYPLPFVDESFFSYPAVSWLDGHGFVYRVHADAPHADDVWAYHFPFFPRLQVPVIALFGANSWSFRIVSFLAANAAILLLCQTLIRNKLPTSSIALALFWLGDRSLMESLNGRMEGHYLLALAAGFALLSSKPSRCNGIFAGVALGTAFGFHPVTFFFPLAGGLWTWRRGGGRSLGCYVAGLAIPAALFLWCWQPLPDCLKQFFWHAGLFDHSDVVGRWISKLQVMGWSRFEILAVVAATPVQFVRLLLLQRRDQPSFDHDIPKLAAIFALCGLLGLLLIVRGALLPYGFVVLTVWPVVSLCGEWESRNRLSRSKMLTGMCLLLAVCWLPSAAWNAMRIREAILWHWSMNSERFAAELRQIVPSDVPVTGNPELLGPVRGAGIAFRPLPWFGRHLMPPADAWLLLTEAEVRTPQQVAGESLRNRRFHKQINLHEADCPLQLRVFIYGPEVPAS